MSYSFLDRDIIEVIQEKAGGDGQFAIAAAILDLSESTRAVAHQIKFLGNGDAATSMGAIEAASVVMRDAADNIANGLGSISDALDGIGEAMREEK